MRRFLLTLAAGLAVLASVNRAVAKGPFPHVNEILFSPTDPNFVVARTTYAVLPSHDNGATWKYICGDVIGIPTTSIAEPELGITQSNALVAGVSPYPDQGLSVSYDTGCSWSCVGGPLAGQSIADVVVRLDTPNVVLAVTSMQLPVDAGGGYLSQVFQSTNDGATWAPLGVPLDPLIRVETIGVAKTDPNRIYITGERGFNTRQAVLLFSNDSGQTWTTRFIGQYDPTQEDRVFIGAVDPTDADRVYVRSSAVLSGGRTRLYVTKDAGESFGIVRSFDVPRPPHDDELTGQLLAFALSPDGNKVYVGTMGDGLFVAPRDSMGFIKTRDMWVYCLATRGNELWACSELGKGGFVIGSSTDDGKTFTTKMSSIYELCGTVDCPNPGNGGPLGCNAMVNGSQCGDSYNSFCMYAVDVKCGTCTPPDAGSDGGETDGGSSGGGHGGKSSFSCGLSASGGGGTAAFFASCTLAAVAAYRRKRTR